MDFAGISYNVPVEEEFQQMLSHISQKNSRLVCGRGAAAKKHQSTQILFLSHYVS